MERDEPAVSSAGLLDITRHRFVEFHFPEAGLWKVRVDGRLNAVATDYEGRWEVHIPDNARPTAEVSATPKRITGSGPIDIVRGRWEKADFTAVDATTLRLEVHGFSLSGKAPWTVELLVEDSAGHVAFAEDFVGRKD